MSVRSKSSFVWEYFEVVPDSNPRKVICKISPCQKLVETGTTYSTHGLWKHLERWHKTQYDHAKSEREKLKKSTADESQKKLSIYTVDPVDLESLSSAASEIPSSDGTSSSMTLSSALSVPSGGSGQAKISDIFPSTEKYKPGSQRQKEINFLIGEWLADAMLPFNTVNNARFRALLENLHSKYQVPKDKLFRTVIIPDIYNRVKAKVEKVVAEQIDYFSATTDMWSSQSRQSYISVTVHFITSTWQRKLIVLACEPFFGDHTGDNIKTVLENILYDWNLSCKLHLFLRDSGSNVIAAMRIGNYDSIPCLLHTLHLIVNAAVLKQAAVSNMLRRVQNCVKYFRNSSKAKEKLRDAQLAMKLPVHSLILGEPTRWSSYYQCLCRLLEQRRAIRDASDALDLDASKTITVEDWKLMDQVKNLLEPFAEATSFEERENACISEVIPTVLKLKRKVTRAASTGVITMKKELLSQIDKYFYGIGGDTQHRNRFTNIEHNELYSIATALDPRFKLRVFGAVVDTDVIRETLVQKAVNLAYERRTEDTSYAGSPSAKRTKPSGFFADLEELIPENSMETAFDDEGVTVASVDYHKTAKEAVTSYLAETLINSDSDPLEYWKMKENELPLLARLARQYLSAPLGTVASEREFKLASDITGDNRINLLPKNAEKLLFLKYNLRAIGYHSFRLPVSSATANLTRENVEIDLEEQVEGSGISDLDESDISENL